ncbi:SPON2 [Cordylochernes scorpioides]|uniref:SPON2 n=1 Tax=Cordylochernes scorpioides TaxID=51811 RepID=A0ABY6KK93_9ARAC|nr:SPON2 [Cordylochernes scorpioides]
MARSVLLALLAVSSAAQCPEGRLGRFALRFSAHWDSGRFPRDFPQWRPVAHWSQLVVPPCSLRSTRAVWFQVSFLVRLIPSPDWFVGVDSAALCDGGGWREDFSLPLRPLDGGLEQGLVFTAPRWPEEVPQPVGPLTDHPASSFNYPDPPPPIASVQIVLLQEFLDLGNRSVDLSTASSPPATTTTTRNPLQPPLGGGIGMYHPRRTSWSSRRNLVPSCHVDEWSSWSPCSQSCGFGRTSRTRQVLSRRQGLPCPPLRQDRTCGSARNCRKPEDYFRWR